MCRARCAICSWLNAIAGLPCAFVDFWLLVFPGDAFLPPGLGFCPVVPAAAPLAFLPLLIYNLIFIMPMIAITLIIYVGLATVGHVSVWREKNIRLLHLVAGLILLGLGIAMLLGFI